MHRKGYGATSLGEILKASGVPKGSFYHHYRNKEAFGLEAVDYHLGFLVSWLDEVLSQDKSSAPLERLRRFFEDYRVFVERRGFREGCPIGSLAQEVGALPDVFREKLQAAFTLMRQPIEQCLVEAQGTGDLAKALDPAETAEFVLNAWQGALLRMKVAGDDGPLRGFEKMIFDALLRR